MWFRFNSPSYNLVDDLLAAGGVEPGPGGGPAFAQPRTYGYGYATDGTRRLVNSTKGDGSPLATYGWTYDVFGNRLSEDRNIGTDPTCGLSLETASYAADDNALRRRINTGSCAKINRYWSDRTGLAVGVERQRRTTGVQRRRRQTT